MFYRLIKKLSVLAVVALSLKGLLGVDAPAFADESVGTKIQNDADDAKRDIKKSGRKAKRKIRNATGHGSVKEDAKDAVEDVKDDVSTETKKLKRKAK